MNIYRLSHVDSTNTEAKRRIRSGEIQEPCVILADEQTKGRGQYGRTWHSPPGNFYASFVVLSDWAPEDISMMIAVYVAKSIDQPVHFKKPNDLLLNGKKVAGVLVEKEGKFWILGTGINLTSSPAIASYATTCLGTALSRECILNRMIRLLEDNATTQEDVRKYWHFRSLKACIFL